MEDEMSDKNDCKAILWVITVTWWLFVFYQIFAVRPMEKTVENVKGWLVFFGLY